MKNTMTVVLVFAAAFAGNAQRLIEKTFNCNNKTNINLNLQIADSIRISTWNKNEVYIKALVSIEDNRYNEEYKVNFGESNGTLAVSAKMETERKKIWNRDSGCCQTNIYWDIMVPERAPVTVETINGNIIITGQTSEIKANSISGFIDLQVPDDLKADFKLSTITGTVYSNIVTPASASFKKHSADISSKYRGGGTSVDLTTVSGDIFLRDKTN